MGLKQVQVSLPQEALLSFLRITKEWIWSLLHQQRQ
jgi:hypothetical protein